MSLLHLPGLEKEIFKGSFSQEILNWFAGNVSIELIIYISAFCEVFVPFHLSTQYIESEPFNGVTNIEYSASSSRKACNCSTVNFLQIHFAAGKKNFFRL